MATDIIVPQLGESVSEATVATWFKQPGDSVAADEPLVELETDKVTVEVPAPVAGTLVEILADTGAEVAVGAVLARVAEGAAAGAATKPAAKPAAPAAPAPSAAGSPAPAAPTAAAPAGQTGTRHPLPPAVRKLVEDNALDPAAIPATGKDGRLTRDDVVRYLKAGGGPAPAPAPAPAPGAPAPAATSAPGLSGPGREAGPREEKVKMTRLRRRIAERLKESQNTAAMLTTFNEVDMSAVMDWRARHKDAFEKRHGLRLGFMSFFVKACVKALKDNPAVNAEISGESIIYKNYYDIGVAVGGPQGLVVPVVRDCDAKSFAEIEAAIAGYGKKARDGALTLEDMAGGTFTVSNGGVYGSLMSTPILNPPQSGILGMHKTQMRPVVLPDGSIAARPMMYLALSYDHRIVDGKEAVTFLVAVKEAIEDPARLLLEV